MHHSPALKSGKLTTWKRAWHAMTHLRPYTPAPLPEFELHLQGTGSMRLEHAQVRRVQGAGGLDDAVAFAGKWPPYHSFWMQGAQDYPSCTSNDTDSSNVGHELVDVTAIGGQRPRSSAEFARPGGLSLGQLTWFFAFPCTLANVVFSIEKNDSRNPYHQLPVSPPSRLAPPGLIHAP